MLALTTEESDLGDLSELKRQSKLNQPKAARAASKKVTRQPLEEVFAFSPEGAQIAQGIALEFVATSRNSEYLWSSIFISADSCKQMERISNHERENHYL